MNSPLLGDGAEQVHPDDAITVDHGNSADLVVLPHLVPIGDDAGESTVGVAHRQARGIGARLVRNRSPSGHS